MFSQTRRAFFYTVAAALFFTAGWACNKYGNHAGIADNAVVAVVDGHNITFKDWMRQMDLLRVFASPIDPDDKGEVKAVLDSLIDQQLVLDAAQKNGFSDSNFDDTLKTRLQAAKLKIQDLKEKLRRDMATVSRLEGHYQGPYKRMLLARQYAASQVDKVVVTNKDLKDWYDKYAAQAAQEGQKLPPFERVKDRIKPNVQAEKFIQDLEAKGNIERKDDVIKKYLDNLSVSDKILGDDMGAGDKGGKTDAKKNGD